MFYIGYPVVLKKKKNRRQCLNVDTILRCFIIPLFPVKVQRLIRSLLLMQFLIQNTPFLNLVFLASVTTLYIFPQDKIYVSNYQFIIFPDEEHLWLIILFSPLKLLNFIAIVWTKWKIAGLGGVFLLESGMINILKFGHYSIIELSMFALSSSSFFSVVLLWVNQ